jgi:hypothetical protein
MMTSEPIHSPSSGAATASNVLLIVDAESLLSRYPQPSLEPQSPTVIEQGLVFFISSNAITKNTESDSYLTLSTHNAKTFHIRSRTVSLLAEHSVVLYDLAVGDAGVLSTPELIVHDRLKVPSPDIANPTQPASHEADDHYWQCSQLVAGVESCELSFMLVDKNCKALGYFSWAVEVKLVD